MLELILWFLYAWAVLNGIISAFMAYKAQNDTSEAWDTAEASKIFALQSIMAMVAVQVFFKGG